MYVVSGDFTQVGYIYKIDDTTSASELLSGTKDEFGCNISYVMGVTATTANQSSLAVNGIPDDHLLNAYGLLQVKVDKSLIDGVFDPYNDDVVSSISSANYISVGFHTVSPQTLSDPTDVVEQNTWVYGVSASDIKQLGGDGNFYYVYLTTSESIYDAAMSASNYPSGTMPTYAPIVSVDGQGHKGFLLYNGNTSDVQGAMLMRIRNGNYDNADLAQFKSATCYDTVSVNQRFVNEWVAFGGDLPP